MRLFALALGLVGCRQPWNETTGTSPPAMGRPCETDAECPEELTCLDGVRSSSDTDTAGLWRICSWSCTTDADCPTLSAHCGQVFTCDRLGTCNDADYAGCK